MKLPVNVVSQRLGHKDASITPSIHTHAMKQYDEEAAAPFAALVMPRGAKGASVGKRVLRAPQGCRAGTENCATTQEEVWWAAQGSNL